MSLSPAWSRRGARLSRDLLAPRARLAALSITVDHRSSLSMIPRTIERRARRDPRRSTRASRLREPLRTKYTSYLLLLLRISRASLSFAFSISLAHVELCTGKRPFTAAERVIFVEFIISHSSAILSSLNLSPLFLSP